MLQRVPNNGYSWWWASHIRTKQSKWLDSNLREMDDTVKNMIKLVEADADSFAKRAELYFKRRPELISYVEDAYRAYRALAERFDSISSELHKANHTIATSCPEQVQYAMLEEQDDDNLPKAITPVDPGRINKRTVEGILKKRRESESSIRKTQNKKPTSEIDTEMAQEEINILQKGILVLQSEKQFIKSSYEGGIAKYWEIEKQIMDMQEKVCYLQDSFDTSAVVEDDEARALTTATALKSCEDAIVRLQEQRKESLEQAKAESERVKIAKEKLKALKGECGQSETENANMSSESTEMNFTAENMEKEADSLNNARLELQSISEKIKEYFKMNPESSAVEIAEKINELVIKVTTLELTVSSQAVQINRLTSESSELEQNLQNLEEEKIILINDSNVLTKRLEDAEEELSKVQAIEKIIRDEEMNYRENFAEACHSLNGISEKLQPSKPLENACDEHACLEDEVSTGSIEPQGACEDKEVTQIRDIKEDLAEEIHVTQPLDHFLGDVFQAKDSQESIALEEMMALITELKNVIAMKDEEIRLLRLELASLKMSSNGSAAAVEDHSQQILESKSNSAMLTNNLNLQDSEMPEDLNMESTTKSDSSVEGMGVPPIEEFRRDVDTLLGKGLAFWLRFSTSFHHVQQLQAKYEDLQADINKLKDNKTQKGNDTVANDRDGKAESALMATRLKELKTELHEWSERSALLRGDLQSRFSSLSNMQEEISTVENTNSKSGEALFTTYKAARLQGEVRNMKQENNKAASELQVGLHQVRRLQTEIEELLARLYRRFEPFVSLNHASSSTGVPLRVFLYGSNSKPKKPSIFARIHPLFWKNSKLRAGHRSK